MKLLINVDCLIFDRPKCFIRISHETKFHLAKSSNRTLELSVYQWARRVDTRTLPSIEALRHIIVSVDKYQSTETTGLVTLQQHDAFCILSPALWAACNRHRLGETHEWYLILRKISNSISLHYDFLVYLTPPKIDNYAF